MEILQTILVALHVIGALAIVVAALVQLRADKRVNAVMLWGARAQLLTGIGLVGVLSADDEDLNYVKITVKLLVALAVVGIAESQRKKGAVAWALWSVLGLTVLNIAIAVAWN